MADLRAARVVYQVHSPQVDALARRDLDEVVARHPVPTGHVAVDARVGADAATYARESLPAARDFTPPLDFDGYAKLRQAKCLYRVEASEVAPEDRGYLRAALLVAGEIAAMSEGLIVDALAFQRMTPEDVLKEVDRPFDALRHVAIHADRGPRPLFVHTHGLEKFGHPDLELHGVPRESVDVARRLLRHLVAAVASGSHFAEGETTQLCGLEFTFEPSPTTDAPHFSAASLCLCNFRLVESGASPAMAALVAS